jgi:hypothetical protein
MQCLQDNATKGETQKIKDEPAVGLCSIDDTDGHAKPDQMVVVFAVSGTILLGLLAANHF